GTQTMTRPDLLFVAVLLGAIGPSWIRAQAPASFDLALTINDGAGDSVYRGWPLVVRGDAALMDGAAAPVALGLSSPTLVVAPAQGPTVGWPLRRVTEFASAPTLGPENESVRIVWVLPA